MSAEAVKLAGLLLDLSAVADPDLDAEGERRFRAALINQGGHTGMVTAHDGEEVIFFADRYHHAFHTSHDRARQPFAKGVVARPRIERMHWIQPIISGTITDIECWEVPLKVPEEGIRRLPGKRLYVSWAESYVIWLEPRAKGGFKFSSAYPVPHAAISAYINRARKIWPRIS